MNSFAGCTAISCARQFRGPKKRGNYLIEETCRHAISGACTYKREPNEIQRSQAQTPQSVGIAS